MTILLVVTGVIEGVAGIGILIVPSVAVTLLLGESLDTVTVLTIARIVGAALLSLGVACWIASQDGRTRSATGLVAGMLLYNAAVVGILTYAYLGSGLTGVLLWPAVALHGTMAIWCLSWIRTGWRIRSRKG